MKRRILILTPLLLACGPFFYQAPPPLERYPHRVPGKTWERLLQDAKPPREDSPSAAETLRVAMKLADVLPLLPVERRQAKIDEMVERNRGGNFSARAATLLLELKEIAGNEKLEDEAGRYLEWRLQAVERKPLLPPARRWDWADEDMRHAEEQYRRDLKDEEDWLEAGKLGTPPFLQPNYELQRAARFLRNQRFDDSLKGFRDLLQASPDHPRSEVACFMIGRCLLEQSRVVITRQLKEEELMVLVKDLRAKSEEAFKDYLRRYPQGRFVSDAHGWLGGLAVDEGLWGDAVGHQMDRLAVRDSREVLASVLRECDWIFAAMFNDPVAATDPDTLAHSLPWGAIARQPQVVRLFVFQALDPVTREKFNDVENFSSDERTVNFLTDRITRPQEFAKRSLSLLGAAIASAGGSDSLSLTVLGWAALRAGENEQALALFEKALLKDRSDELLQGHAAALAAVGRHAEAARAYAELGRDYPESQLAGTVEFDAAMARFHAGEAGEALLELIPLSRRSWDRPTPGTLHAEFEPIQWIDTIAQFAPIEQLAKPLVPGTLGGTREDLLRAIVRYRALAAGNFDLAKQYLDLPNDPSATEQEDAVLATASMEWRKFVPMDQAHWDREVQPLADLEAKLAGSPDDAALHLEAGKLWQSLRGKVTMPIHRFFDFSNSEPDKLHQLRCRNAAFFGIPANEATSALDSRDELNRALVHFLQAAEHSPDPAIAAPALELANEALFRLGEFSRYHAMRAFEGDHTALSAKLVARLKRDFPDRPEAARAIAWTFTDPANLKRWMPGSGPEWLVTNRMAAEISGRFDSQDDEIEFYALLTRLKALGSQEFAHMAAAKGALSELRDAFAIARPKFTQDRILALVDHLDDLGSVAEAPGITLDLFQRYATMRIKGDAPPVAEGEWLPLKPWLAFWDLARPSVDHYGFQRPRDISMESWAAYLRDFPDSPKAEAAALRILRAKVQATCSIPLVKYCAFPESPLLRGYSHFEGKPQPAEEDLEKLRQAIAAHQQRFPDGRYQADVLMLRATVGMAGPHPEEGVKDLAAILGDSMHPELHIDAVQHLGCFSMRLLDPAQRLEVGAALRQSPEVLPYLRKLANGRTFLIRLKQFLPWIEAS
ncbi:hypothetical protein [Haloferula sp. BvORR071]|uniref:hypothetical protein n=1 Tax=Haloferula sp. BvORR071 TaxID=1396141 RepID=UPI0005577E28|nr:hypothetical protein [Haloferula sp. BvORR071]